MARKTKEEALETRNQLLDAAEDVFFNVGYARTTLEAVAEAAGMTRGAIYWHFKNKSDLFNAMCDRVRLPMEELADEGHDQHDGNPMDHLRKICVFFFSQCEQNPHLYKVMDILFRKTEFVDQEDPTYIRQHEAFMRGRERITRQINLAVQRNFLPSDTDTRLAAILLQSTIEGMLQNWLNATKDFTLAEEGGRLIDACIGTISTSVALRKKKPVAASE
jgi:TetR/AcrR family transcriptional regulator, acrAB operon repressor